MGKFSRAINSTDEAGFNYSGLGDALEVFEIGSL